MPVAPDRRGTDPPDDGGFLPQRDGTGDLRLAWGNISLGLRGPAVIIVVLLLALGAGLFYMNYINVLAHAEMVQAMLMQTCLTSLTSEEKIALREAAKRDPRAWSDLLYYNCFYLRNPPKMGLRWGGTARASTVFSLDRRGGDATIPPSGRIVHPLP